MASLYVELAKSAAGPLALAGVIDRCLKSKDVFTFGELLDLPAVQALAGTAHGQALALLELFAYGSYDDWKSGRAAGTFPDLPEASLRKLKQLSLVSIASDRKVLPYSELAAQLDVADARSVEDLVISAMYAGLLAGKLDQRAQVLEVASTSGRDVRPEPAAVHALLDRITAWRSAVDAALAATASQVETAAAVAAKERSTRATQAAEIALHHAAVAAAAPTRSAGGGFGGVAGSLGDFGSDLDALASGSMGMGFGGGGGGGSMSVSAFLSALTGGVGGGGVAPAADRGGAAGGGFGGGDAGDAGGDLEYDDDDPSRR